MAGEGANIGIFTFLFGSNESDDGFLPWKHYWSRGDHVFGFRDIMSVRTICPKRYGGFDYSHPTSRLDEHEVVHHLVHVVEKQFHFFARLDVKGNRVELKPGLDGEAKFGSFGAINYQYAQQKC